MRVVGNSSDYISIYGHLLTVRLRKVAKSEMESITRVLDPLAFKVTALTQVVIHVDERLGTFPSTYNDSNLARDKLQETLFATDS